MPAVLVSSLLILTSVNAQNILNSKVFVIPIKPEIFNWNVIDGRPDQFSYQPSLLNAPDLPPWIHYTYSKRDHHGFIYGVPPNDQKSFQLEIVSLNKRTYETRYCVLDVNVDKENTTKYPKKYEVKLKIENLNVEDMFDQNRTQALLDVFRYRLWKEATEIYVSFLASSVEVGGRLPLKPDESEGVVIKLGSSIPFSQELNELQEQLKPLWKLPSCNFKRATEERHFRDAGFVTDWCYFRLLGSLVKMNGLILQFLLNKNKLETDLQNSQQRESARRGEDMNVIVDNSYFEHSEWQWARTSKSSIPTRNYLQEIVVIIIVPALLMFILASLLSTALCLHHDKITDPESEEYFNELFNVFLKRRTNVREKNESYSTERVDNNGVQMVQYAVSERGILRSLSLQPSSPNASQDLRVPTERCNPYIRPNPPPYIGPNNAGIRTDF